MFDYSVTNITQSIRDIVYAGSSNRDWNDDKLIRLLNREIAAYLVPMLLSARKNHLDTYLDTALNSGQAAYWLPSKAAGSKARAVQLVDQSGQPYAPLRELALEDAINFGSGLVSGNFQTGLPAGYYWRGDQLVLWPVPDGSLALSLRIYFANRPSTLVPNASCVRLSAAPTSGSGTFTVPFAAGTLPAAGYSDGSKVDLVQASPGFDVLFSGPIVSHTSSSLTFSGALPGPLQSGDWICVSDTAPVVTGAIPEIVVGCLVEQCALKCLNSRSDNDTFNRQRGIVSTAEKSAKQYLNRRNTGDRAVVGAGGLSRFKGPRR